MQLYLIRHAPAVARRHGRPDARRPLTKRGRERFMREVKGLKAMGVRFDRLFHSPWKRAVQTAELTKPLLEGKRIGTEHLAALPRNALLDELSRGGKRVAVIGHEPWLTQLLAWLVFDDPHLGRNFELKKGGVAVLEGTISPGKMKLLALLTPRALRSVG